MHKDELWQEFDKNGNRLGAISPENCDYEKVQFFGSTAIMLYRFNGEKVEFLFQKRSKLIDRHPEKWDVSAGGHINFEENTLDSAVRETAEEIGVKISKKDLEFAAIYVRGGIIHLYFCDWTGKGDGFHFDDKEVETVKWVSFDDLVAFWPNLKPSLKDDQIFQFSLLEWTKQARKKHEHLDK